jgi:hypothetical protein
MMDDEADAFVDLCTLILGLFILLVFLALLINGVYECFPSLKGEEEKK